MSELHYVKASQLFLVVDRPAEFLRTVLDRAGLVEAQLPAVKGEGARYKLLLQVLDIVLETGVVVARLVETEEVVDKEEWEEERKMLETLVQRIQFILLSMVKLGNVGGKSKKTKPDKKGGGGNIKDN